MTTTCCWQCGTKAEHTGEKRQTCQTCQKWQEQFEKAWVHAVTKTKKRMAA